MNTNQSANPNQNQPVSTSSSFASDVQSLNELMSTGKPVDPSSPDANIRESTIVTATGERIELNRDSIKQPDIIKK